VKNPVIPGSERGHFQTFFEVNFPGRATPTLILTQGKNSGVCQGTYEDIAQKNLIGYRGVRLFFIQDLAAKCR
jgi:hypothetical protein